MKKIHLFVLLPLLFIWGCDCCYDIPNGRKWVKYMSAQSFTDQLAGAFVADQGVSVSGLSVTVNGTTYSTNTALNSADQNSIENEMVNQGLYNPATQSIFFFQSNNTVTLNVGDAVEWNISIPGGAPSSGNLIAGGTTISDLNDGLPLSNFQSITDDLSVDCSTIPTLSQWGLFLLTLFLLSLATVGIQQRQTVLATSQGVNLSTPRTKLFDRATFLSLLVKMSPLFLLGFLGIYLFFGEIVAPDLLGWPAAFLLTVFIAHRIFMDGTLED